VLSTISASWFFIEPTHSLKLDEDVLVFMAAIVIASLPIVWLLERTRLAVERLTGTIVEQQRLRDELSAAEAVRADDVRRERFLAGATDALTSSLDYESTLIRLAELVVPAAADWCGIDLVEGEPLGVEPMTHVERGRIDPRIALALRRAARTSAASGARSGVLLQQLPGEVAGSAIFVELAGHGSPPGSMILARTGGHPYDETDRVFAEGLARRAGIAVENARLHRAAEAARATAEAAATRARRLQGVLDATFSSGSLDEFLRQLLDRLREAIGADTATILTVDEPGETLVVRRSVGRAGTRGLRVPFGSGFAGRIAETRMHRAVRDVAGAGLKDVGPLSPGVVSMAGAPLLAGDSLVGVLQVGSRTPRDFDDEDVMLLRLVAARAATSVERRQAHEHEQAVAEALQRSLLPGRLPTIDGIEAAARYVPGTVGLEIGGDWYDVFELEDGSVGITVGDVMGRGIQAAAAMGHLRHVVRAYALEGLGPSETLARLDRIASESEIFATVVYAILSRDRTTMQIANAGHPPPLVRSPNGSVRRLDVGRSLPIGSGAGAPFVEATIHVEPDSSLIFYTDGLVERREESIDAGIDRLAALIGGPKSSVHQLVDGIIEELTDGGQPDDRAILAVRLQNATAERMTIEFPPEAAALASARDSLRDWLRGHGAHTDEIFEIVFAVNEACSNAVEHPLDVRDTKIGLEAEIANGRVAIVVNDGGRWRADSTSMDRGRGLGFMNELMEHVEIVRSSDGTSVRLERALAGAPTWSLSALAE
jgi:serine phosphatase RsbU (regulator of sigma subunit)